MKQKYHDLALAAGGSHYPSVGGKLLENYSDLLVKDLIQYLESASTAFDEDQGQGIRTSARLIKEYFEV